MVTFVLNELAAWKVPIMISSVGALAVAATEIPPTSQVQEYGVPTLLLVGLGCLARYFVAEKQRYEKLLADQAETERKRTTEDKAQLLAVVEANTESMAALKDATATLNEHFASYGKTLLERGLAAPGEQSQS